MLADRCHEAGHQISRDIIDRWICIAEGREFTLDPIINGKVSENKGGYYVVVLPSEPPVN